MLPYLHGMGETTVSPTCYIYHVSSYLLYSHHVIRVNLFTLGPLQLNYWLLKQKHWNAIVVCQIAQMVGGIQHGYGRQTIIYVLGGMKHKA